MIKLTAVSTVLAALLLVGCDDASRSAQTQNDDATPATFRETVEDEAMALLDATNELMTDAAREKDEAMGSAERLLSALGSKIDAWRSRASEAGSEFKQESAEALEKLASKKDALARKLAELKDASTETWQDVQPDLKAAMEDLKRAYAKAAARFNGDGEDGDQNDAQP